MASRYYGINLGEHQNNVAEGASTNSTAIELVIDRSKVTTQQQVFDAMEYIKGYLMNQATRIPAI